MGGHIGVKFFIRVIHRAITANTSIQPISYQYHKKMVTVTTAHIELWDRLYISGRMKLCVSYWCVG